MSHEGVTCDGCGISNFTGMRYRCFVCYDYDLCHACAIRQVTTKQHLESHPLQQIPAGESRGANLNPIGFALGGPGDRQGLSALLGGREGDHEGLSRRGRGSSRSRGRSPSSRGGRDTVSSVTSASNGSGLFGVSSTGGFGSPSFSRPFGQTDLGDDPHLYVDEFARRGSSLYRGSSRGRGRARDLTPEQHQQLLQQGGRSLHPSLARQMGEDVALFGSPSRGRGPSRAAGRWRADVSNYSCPYCGAAGLASDELYTHVLSSHADDNQPVVCPICAQKPGGDPNYVSSNFQAHLQVRHKPPRSRKGEDDSSRTTEFLNRLRETSSSKKNTTAAAVSARERQEAQAVERQQIKQQQLRGIFVQELITSTLVNPR